MPFGNFLKHILNIILIFFRRARSKGRMILIINVRAAAMLTTAMCVSSLAHAQSQSAETGQIRSGERTSDDIIVTAARSELPASALPMTIDILDGEDFRDQAIVSGSVIDAVSARFPAFSPTREKLSGAGESLRGRSPLYTINGIPQSTPIRDGSRDGYTIDPFFVDRVEVIYGSNSLQGIGATGGVVNQVTVGAPEKDGVSGRAMVQVTAQDGFDGEAMGGKAAGYVGIREGAFDATVGASFERRGVFLDGNGNRVGVDGTQGEIQDSDSWSLFGRLGYQLSDTARVEIVANRFELEGNNNYVLVAGDRAAGVPASSERGTTPGDAPSNVTELVSLSLVEEDLAGGIFALQGFYNKSEAVYGGGTFQTFQDPAFDPTGNLFDQSANKSRKMGGKISYEREMPGFEALTLTAGFDALFDETEQYLVQTGREWVPETEFRSLAPFAQANLALIDGKLRLAGGVRYEDVRLKVDDFETLASYGATDPNDISTYRPLAVEGGEPSFTEWLWNGGVIVEPIDGIRGYASYAEGYTLADVGRILRGISDPGVDIDNFLTLEPVISNNYEVGVEVQRGPLDASVSYFWSSSDLGSVLRRNSDGIFEVLRQPIDLEGLDISLATQTPVPGLTLSTAYSHVIGKTDADDDGAIDEDLDGANISPDRINVAADYRRGPLSARVQGRFYLSRNFNVARGNANLGNFGGYELFDAYLGYETGLGEVSFAVQNLTDEQYVSYNSQTERVQDDGRFFAGRGRTFILAFAKDF